VNNKETAMEPSWMAQARRVIGKAATMGLLALLLVGMAASPAAAMTRSHALVLTAQFLAWCNSHGGTPSYTGGTNADCTFGDGSGVLCQFYPDPYCVTYPPPRTGNPNGVQSWDAGNALSEGGATNEAGASGESIDAATTTSQVLAQLHTGGPDHSKSHRHHKSKHGKK
jgi:hypothetical protein